MKIHFRILILLCFTSFIQVIGQKRFDPSPEDKILAKSLKEKYSNEEDRIAVINSDHVYEFHYNKFSRLVEVDYTKKEKYMNISKISRIRISEFYNDNSEIILFDIRGKTNKKVSNDVYDGYYEDDDFFYSDARFKSTSLNFPVQGYSYTLNMKKRFKDIKYFTSVYFTDRFPIEGKKIVFKIPNWLDVELKELNFEGHLIEKTITEEGSIKIYTYQVRALNAIVHETQMVGPSHREPHILILPKSHTKEYNGEVTLFKETGDLYAWYKSLMDRMKEDPSKLQPLVDELTANAKTEEDKIKNIYYWVQDNIRYIAFEDGIAGFKPDESQNVYEKKYGDCKGMANLLRQMLILAGFDAHLTWIGTNRIAYDYSTPNLAVDNHMICTLNYKGERYFLDGTQKYNALGDYAQRIQGRQVLIEDGDDFILDYVPNKTSNLNIEHFNLNYHIEGNALKGNAQKRFNGESKSQFLFIYNSLKSENKEDVLKKYLNEDNKNIEISEIKTTNLTDREIETQIDYNLSINNQISNYDGEYFIDLDYFKEYAGLELKERQSNFLMSYKTNYDSKITLEIPEGYMVTYKPENLSYNTDHVHIEISYKVEGNVLVYTKLFDFKTGEFPKEELEGWRVFNKALVNTYKDQITISKL